MRFGPLIGIALLGFAALALIAGHPQPAGSVYAVPIAEARQELAKTGLPPLVFGLGAPLVALVGTNVGAGQRERAVRIALSLVLALTGIGETALNA